MSESEKEYTTIQKNGLYLLEIEDDEPIRTNTNISVNEDELKQVSRQLNWTSSSFDEYLDGLIAPIPLQRPKRNETKLMDVVQSNNTKQKYVKIQLPNNITEILEQDFYTVNKTQDNNLYAPYQIKFNRIYF